MPDTVRILSGDDYVALQSSGKQTWTYKDVVVQVKQAGDAVSVFVQSPTLPLKEVQLQWQYATPKAATVLGDAWERTYGNISWQQVAATKKLPWYCVVHDDKNTICFGVKTG